MPVKATPNVSTLGPRLRKTAAVLERGNKNTLNQAALAAKKTIVARMMRDTGGDGVLSGVGRNGRRLDVSYKLEGTASNPRAFIKALGPWPLIENNTRGRVIRSRHSVVRGSSGRGRLARAGFVGPLLPGQVQGNRRAVLNIPGIGYRRSARHPGTKGKKTFAKGRQASAPIVTQILRKRSTEIVKAGVFG